MLPIYSENTSKEAISMKLIFQLTSVLFVMDCLPKLNFNFSAGFHSSTPFADLVCYLSEIFESKEKTLYPIVLCTLLFIKEHIPVNPVSPLYMIDWFYFIMRHYDYVVAVNFYWLEKPGCKYRTNDLVFRHL